MLKSLNKKLRNDGYVLYLSRYGQITREMEKNRIGDGYYMWPTRDVHSFYREFTTEETHNMMERRKFQSLRNWSARGTEQVLLYGKGSSTWI